MYWNYVAAKPRHWESSLPNGYFVVVEDTEDNGKTYAVYQGDYNDWFLMTGNQLTRIGEYKTVREAKAGAEAFSSL
ncbi:MAG: hypothetical protein RBS80_05875 [Thermoguttaceae bacterium]|jgi:hypothetical protein|nr:hypothetical protein [Thermoguttaceae bacterium]